MRRLPKGDNMHCGICNEEIEQLMDDDGMDYVMPCSGCIKTTYAEGVATGYKLAGRDPAELAEEL